VNQGDLVNIYISTVASTATAHTNLDGTVVSGLKDSGITVLPRSTINLVITPESGLSTNAGFAAPSFGVKKSVALWP
jgi:flagellin FlaB